MNSEANEALSFELGAGDMRDEIARLEARLEELTESLARCGKLRLAAQIAVVGGGIWLVAAMIGIIGFDPVAMMVAIAGVIGGTVLYGSNATTAQQFEAEMKEAEAKRAALIGTLDLRVVGAGRAD
jgi:Flp pilus assembly protein TadB